jgi:P-type Mg2+ transporter
VTPDPYRGRPDSAPTPDALGAYWALDPAGLLRRMCSDPAGLSSAEAARRLARHGPNELRKQSRLSRVRVLWNQLRSPLLLLLVFAAGASALTGAWVEAAIVMTILVASVVIGYSREYRAELAADELRARVQVMATVFRDTRP